MVRIWRFISLATVSCATSMLFSFVSRFIVDLAVPIIIIRMLIIVVMFWLLYDQNTNKGMYGVIGGALSAGWLLGHWDEFLILIKYHFLENFMLPTVLVAIVLFIIASGYASLVKYYARIKAESNPK